MLASTYPLLPLLVAALPGLVPASRATGCDDPVPFDTRVVTQEMGLKSFVAAHQVGSVCYVWWDGGSAPILMIYGPTWVAEFGHTFNSTRHAAAQYAAESPHGVQPVPGAAGAFMVFDPATRTRRVFVEHGGNVYMIVSQDQVPVGVLAKAIQPRLLPHALVE